MDRNEIAKVMQAHGWLSRRPAQFGEAVLARCRVRQYEAYEAVYRDGDPSDCLMGLVSGRWFVRMPPADTVIGVGEPGFWIGEAGFFRGAQRAASVISVTPSIGLYLPPAAFNELAANAEYCRHFAANTAETLAEAIAVISTLSQPKSDIRVAQRIANLATFQAGAVDGVITISQADLAEMCGVGRSTIVAILQDLVDRGFIELQYRRMRITDMTGLSDFAFNQDRLWR
jgi:CRP-like cAMP-binding protein